MNQRFHGSSISPKLQSIIKAANEGPYKQNPPKAALGSNDQCLPKDFKQTNHCSDISPALGENRHGAVET